MNTVPITNDIWLAQLHRLLKEVEGRADSADRNVRMVLIKDNINILKGNITVH